MKYKFKSEGLLKLRKFEEHKKKVELGQVNRAILKTKHNIDQAREDIKRAHEGVKMAEKEGRVNHFFLSCIQILFKEGKTIFNNKKIT